MIETLMFPIIFIALEVEIQLGDIIALLHVKYFLPAVWVGHVGYFKIVRVHFLNSSDFSQSVELLVIIKSTATQKFIR